MDTLLAYNPLLTNYRIPKGEIPALAEWLGVSASSLYRYLAKTTPSQAVMSRLYHERGVPPALWKSSPAARQASLYLLYLKADKKSQTAPTTNNLSLYDIF